uniref:Uncharacterized protein n=1 Tax=Rhizophora mucronata TaxID=61149 RepID=A0A2P2NS66_RHIMU
MQFTVYRINIGREWNLSNIMSINFNKIGF